MIIAIFGSYAKKEQFYFILYGYADLPGTRVSNLCSAAGLLP
jgi:hypothetical protein